MKTLEASKILNISASTLRIWADKGIIKVDISPTGIRRYSEENIYYLKAQMQKSTDITGEYELIKTGEVARMLEISKPSVRKYAAEGIIKAVSTTPTGLKLYRKSDIEEVKVILIGKTIAQLRLEQVGTDI